MEIIYLLIGSLVGFTIAWLLSSQRNQAKQITQQAELQATKQLLLDLQARNKQIEQRELEQQKVYEDKLSQLAIANTRLVQQEKELAEKQLELQELNARLTSEFKLIAESVLEAKTNNLSQTHQKWMENILKPLKDQIEKFENKVQSTHSEALQVNSALKAQVDQLYKQSNEITREAQNLANALKGSVKTQGNWGELILEKILERSGLTRDKEFIVQASMTSEDGRRLQPDVVVMLPENKSVVIDSKVSLLAYEQYASSDDEQTRALHLKQHIQAIRNHIKGLSDKKYQQLYQLNTVDFVIMFMPVEPAFALAVQHDSELWAEAFERNIVLVSTSTLLATLRTISMMWRQDRMNNNALEIARQSGALYDKFTGFIQDMIEMGKKLQGAQESYGSAMNKLSTGNGNIVKRLEDIRKLGAGASKQLPQAIVDRSEL
jgi:DNA recombination protein RmuC